MIKKMKPENLDECLGKGPQSALETKLIQAYLATKGYQLADIPGLPEKFANQLMKEACQYASLKLAEVDAKVRFRQNVRYE